LSLHKMWPFLEPIAHYLQCKRRVGEIFISDRNSEIDLTFAQSRIAAKTRAFHKYALCSVYINSIIAFLMPCNATGRKWRLSP
jgi:hypothetical protein